MINILEKESHTIHYGFIVDNGKVIDEVMVLLMKNLTVIPEKMLLK